MSRRFSFEVVNAVDYDELRPGYAPEAVEWVASRSNFRPGSRVVDLAAGTGQLSRRLSDLELQIVAVEPAANMRAALRARMPTIRIEEGTAESMPLESRSVDAVVVGNAFHHFERNTAFAEIARVLRPGGTLVLFWAWPLEDEELPYPELREVNEVVEAARRSNDIATAYRSWQEPPAAAPGFGAFERRDFPVMHILPSARLADLYATSSDVASLPESVRIGVLERVRILSRGLPDTLHLRARSVVDLCFRT